MSSCPSPTATGLRAAGDPRAPAAESGSRTGAVEEVQEEDGVRDRDRPVGVDVEEGAVAALLDAVAARQRPRADEEVEENRDGMGDVRRAVLGQVAGELEAALAVPDRMEARRPAVRACPPALRQAPG